MDELDVFISVLNEECKVLKKAGVMPNSVAEPWRYYSPPLDGEHDCDHLRSVLEAGKCIVEAEESGAGKWCALAKAQQALLKSLSAEGKAKAKKLGQARGGSSKSEELYYQVFCIADDLLATGESERGLAKKVNDKLDVQFNKTENQIRDILKKQQHMLVNR